MDPLPKPRLQSLDRVKKSLKNDRTASDGQRTSLRAKSRNFILIFLIVLSFMITMAMCLSLNAAWTKTQEKLRGRAKSEREMVPNKSESIPSIKQSFKYILLLLLAAAILKLSMKCIPMLATRYRIDEQLKDWATGVRKILPEVTVPLLEPVRSMAARGLDSKVYAAVLIRPLVSRSTDTNKIPLHQQKSSLLKPNTRVATFSSTFFIGDPFRDVSSDRLKLRQVPWTSSIISACTNQADCSIPRGIREQNEGLDGFDSESTSSTRSTGSAGAGSIGTEASNSRKSPSSSVRKRTRSSTTEGHGSQNNEESDEDGWERPHKRKGGSTGAVSSASKRLKCPYYQKDPVKHSRNSCSGRGFADMAKLKDHLKRVHVAPLRCKRCWATAQSEESLEEHARQEPVCTTQPKPNDNRMSLQQLQNLNLNRAPFAHAKGVEGKWKILYRLLFPEDGIIPSPYADYGLNAQFDRMLIQRLNNELVSIFGPSQARKIQELSDKLPTLIRECKQSNNEVASPSEAITSARSGETDKQWEALTEVQLSSLEFQQDSMNLDLPVFAQDDILKLNASAQWSDLDIDDLQDNVSQRPNLFGDNVTSSIGFMSETSIPEGKAAGLLNAEETNSVQLIAHDRVDPLGALNSSFDSDISQTPLNQNANLDSEIPLQVYNTLNHEPGIDFDWNAWIDQPLSAATGSSGLSGMEKCLERVFGRMSPPPRMMIWK